MSARPGNSEERPRAGVSDKSQRVVSRSRGRIRARRLSPNIAITSVRGYERRFFRRRIVGRDGGYIERDSRDMRIRKTEFAKRQRERQNSRVEGGGGGKRNGNSEYAREKAARGSARRALGGGAVSG